MSVLPAPHTYDDPRILYDDAVIFYDGNPDIIFITPEKKKIRGGGIVGSLGKRKETVYPKEEIINLTFKTSIESINGVNLPYNYSKTSTYKFKKTSDIDVIVLDLTVGLKNKNIESFLTGVASNNLSEHVSSSLFFNKLNELNVKSTIIK